MLAAVVFIVQPIQTTTLPRHTGPAVQAWFLDQVRRHNAHVAARLHPDPHDSGSQNREYPYTTSEIVVTPRRQDGAVPISPSSSLYIRVTSYDPELSELLLVRIVPSLLQATIRITQIDFRIVDVAIEPHVHPRAGLSRYSTIMAEFASKRPQSASFTLEFLSPTIFRSNGLFLPFPLPRLVFGGLARRWNLVSAHKIPAEFGEFIEQGIGVSHYHLQTRPVYLSPRDTHPACSGFVGRCRFAITERTAPWSAWAHLLAEFAAFAGVGKGVTRGLGQVRVV